MTYYVIIRGPLGCGKSTISERIANKLKAKHIPIDRILDKYNLTEELENGYISQKSFIKTNEIVTHTAKVFLQKGTPIVFDGNFYWKSQIDDLIKRLKFPSYVFTLKAPLRICIERDKKRSKAHGKDAAKAVYKKSTQFKYGIIINVTKPIKESIKKIISYLPE